MKRLLLALTMILLYAVVASGATIDVRDYIDSGSRYSQTDSLTAAGTYSDVVWFTGARTIACDFHVTALTTNVVVRLECSNDNEALNWSNCDGDGENITVTADGQYSIVFSHASVYRYYRFAWITEAGGTDAKIGVSFRIGDKI